MGKWHIAQCNPKTGYEFGQSITLGFYWPNDFINLCQLDEIGILILIRDGYYVWK